MNPCFAVELELKGQARMLIIAKVSYDQNAGQVHVSDICSYAGEHYVVSQHINLLYV